MPRTARDSDIRPVQAKTRIVGISLLVFAVVVAVANLILGWAFGVEFLVRLRDGYPAMVPETAACIVLAANGALSAYSNNMRGVRLATGSIVLLIVVQAQWSPISAPGIVSSDAMSLATLLALVTLSLSLMVRWGVSFKTLRFCQCLDTFGLCVVMVPLLGYLYDAEALFTNPFYTSMALHTALALAAIFVSLLLVRPDTNWIGILLAPEHGSIMARKTLPTIVATTLVLCGLALLATRRALVTADFRLSLLAFVMIVITALSVLYFAHLTNRSERRAIKAEEELHKSERARQASELAAVRAQKVEAMGQLVGGVAHDFNNTLTVVIGNLELLQEDDDEKARDMYISEAITASNHAANLTRQLLAYGRKSRLEPLPNVLDDLIAPSLAMFRRICPANITVATALGAKRAVAEVDVGNFQQALLNVLINARDAMPDGGSITVTTRAGYVERPSFIGIGEAELLPDQQYVTVSVRDTGPGMETETLRRASEPFFTTKQVGEGSGLGLSMVSGYCRQSGGGMTIESEPGEGAMISMFFPVTDVADFTVEDVTAGYAGPYSTGAGILIVDDEIQVTRVVARQLQLDGHRVRVALNAEQALAILSSEELPNLVITDMVMPGPMQGHDLAKIIREKYPSIGLLLMSGYESARRRREVVAMQGVPFLQKPIDRATLRVEVAKALNSKNLPS